MQVNSNRKDSHITHIEQHQQYQQHQSSSSASGSESNSPDLTVQDPIIFNKSLPESSAVDMSASPKVLSHSPKLASMSSISLLSLSLAAIPDNEVVPISPVLSNNGADSPLRRAPSGTFNQQYFSAAQQRRVSHYMHPRSNSRRSSYTNLGSLATSPGLVNGTPFGGYGGYGQGTSTPGTPLNPPDSPQLNPISLCSSPTHLFLTHGSGINNTVSGVSGQLSLLSVSNSSSLIDIPSSAAPLSPELAPIATPSGVPPLTPMALAD